MYAIIEESGGQRKVAEGQTVLIDLYQGGQAEPGAALTFEKVLVVGDIGGEAKIGRPYVEGASVAAEILEPLVMGDKLHIHKFKPKVGYKRKTGHRQRYTRVRISRIQG